MPSEACIIACSKRSLMRLQSVTLSCLSFNAFSCVSSSTDSVQIQTEENAVYGREEPSLEQGGWVAFELLTTPGEKYAEAFFFFCRFRTVHIRQH
jgi:hypothetical protein